MHLNTRKLAAGTLAAAALLSVAPVMAQARGGGHANQVQLPVTPDPAQVQAPQPADPVTQDPAQVQAPEVQPVQTPLPAVHNRNGGGRH
jgi:hypothetical protein